MSTPLIDFAKAYEFSLVGLMESQSPNILFTLKCVGKDDLYVYKI